MDDQDPDVASRIGNVRFLDCRFEVAVGDACARRIDRSRSPITATAPPPGDDVAFSGVSPDLDVPPGAEVKAG